MMATCICRTRRRISRGSTVPTQRRACPLRESAWSGAISKARMMVKKHLLLHLAAETEAFLRGSSGTWRRREFRSLGVVIGDVFSTRRHFNVHRPGGIQIGERAAFGDYTQLMNFTRIEIGDDFLSA